MKKYLAILLSVLFLLCACQSQATLEPDLSKFEIIDAGTYLRDNRECGVYYLTVHSEATDNELFAAMESLMQDGYYLHTVWFYEPDDSETRSSPIAILHQDSEKMLTLKKPDGTILTHSGKGTADHVVSLILWYFLFALLVVVLIFFAILFIGFRGHQRKKREAQSKKEARFHTADPTPLSNLQSLLDAGIITPEEFEERKQRL